jgi:outer membrane biosynthesis protein TonB
VVEDAVELDARRRREFRRMVVISVVVHASALGLAVSNPAPRAVAPPQVISVALVSDPTKRAPVRPSPPRPAVPKQTKTVLPAQPRQEVPKPKPAAKPEPRKEIFPDPAPKEEKSLEDLLADFREEQGEPAPQPPAQPVQTAAAVPTPGSATGSGRVSPEVADWMRRAKIHVKSAWVVPPGFRTEALTTHVIVTLDAAGNVVGTPEIARRSGNPWYDEGVVRAIAKASPLPRPPEAGEWDFVFVPEDSF